MWRPVESFPFHARYTRTRPVQKLRMSKISSSCWILGLTLDFSGFQNPEATGTRLGSKLQRHRSMSASMTAPHLWFCCVKFACDVTVSEWFECASHDPLPVLLGAGTSGASGSVASPSSSHLPLSAVGSSDLEILCIICQECLDRLYRASQTFRHLHEHLHGCKLMQTPGITEFGYYIFERR